ncbi:unnamed protein product [Adineta ricciae]|nr:unnamed protein product [Adineta ricciae]
MTNNGEYSNKPRPRLCHLRRWPDFNGYGFNLHCEKNKPGQFIGKVDRESPAESAGLREGDRIIEVNHVPIGNENHTQVVARIKEGVSRDGTKHPDEVILLVVDPDTDEYYKRKSIVIRSNDPNVEKLGVKNRNASDNSDDSPVSSNRSMGKGDSPLNREIPSPMQARTSENSRQYKNVTEITGSKITPTKNVDSPTTSRTSDRDYDRVGNTYLPSSPPSSDKNNRRELPSNHAYTNINSSPKSPPRDVYAKPIASSPARTSASNGFGGGVLEMTMSVAEYRAKLKEQHERKRDPRQTQQMTMKQKHELIDGL